MEEDRVVRDALVEFTDVIRPFDWLAETLITLRMLKAS